MTINNTEALEEFFNKILTQMEVLQRFFLDNQNRLIALEAKFELLKIEIGGER